MIILFALYLGLYSVSYFAVFLLFTAFFDRPRWSKATPAVRTIGGIALLLAVTFTLVYLIPNKWWGNRLQHALGGGITAFYMCRCILQDADLPTSRFQTLVFCFFTVTALGVANELAESIVQALAGMVLSPTTTDTWLDLWSNTVGIAMASAIFVVHQLMSPPAEYGAAPLIELKHSSGRWPAE